MADLTGTKALVIVTNYGIEQDELLRPVADLRDAGVEVTVAAQENADIVTLVGDKDPGETVSPDAVLSSVSPSDFDLLGIPGGTINADTIRQDADAQSIVTAIARAGKPIAAICHGPWLLVETGLADGRTVTSFPSLRTDLVNAGATWTDDDAVVDTTGGFTTITSRDPDDLDAFSARIREVLGAAVPAA